MTRLVPVVLLMLLACGRPAEEPDAPTVPEETVTAANVAPEAAGPVRTDRSSYALTDRGKGPEATIVTTLRAPADRAVYIMNCNGAVGVSLQRQVDGEWAYAWAVAMNACLSEPIVVPPGGDHTTSLYLHEHAGGVIPPGSTRMIEPGTYRIVWTGVLTAFDPNVRGFGPELPLEERISGPITIE